MKTRLLTLIIVCFSRLLFSQEFVVTANKYFEGNFLLNTKEFQWEHSKESKNGSYLPLLKIKNVDDFYKANLLLKYEGVLSQWKIEKEEKDLLVQSSAFDISNIDGERNWFLLQITQIKGDFTRDDGKKSAVKCIVLALQYDKDNPKNPKAFQIEGFTNYEGIVLFTTPSNEN